MGQTTEQGVGDLFRLARLNQPGIAGWQKFGNGAPARGYKGHAKSHCLDDDQSEAFRVEVGWKAKTIILDKDAVLRLPTDKAYMFDQRRTGGGGCRGAGRKLMLRVRQPVFSVHRGGVSLELNLLLVVKKSSGHTQLDMQGRAGGTESFVGHGDRVQRVEQTFFACAMADEQNLEQMWIAS